MNSDIIFLANPSQTMRSVLKEMPKKINSKFVICSKGVEKNTNMLMSEVLTEFFQKLIMQYCQDRIFLFEVMKGLPTATVLSSENLKFTKIYLK